MSDIHEFLKALQSRGAQFWLEDGQLRYRARTGVLSATDVDVLKRSKEAVMAALSSDRRQDLPPLTKRSPHEVVPLTHWQKQWLYWERLGSVDGAYNTVIPVRRKGALQRAALQRTLDTLLFRHEGLRTKFIVAGADTVQVTTECPRLELEEADVSAALENVREGDAKAIASDFKVRAFDPLAGPRMRALLIRLARDDHLLVITAHHVVMDEPSRSVLLGEFVQLYAAFSSGYEPSLPLPKFQMGDYAIWLQERIRGDLEKDAQEYWRPRLAHAAALQLPSKSPQTHASPGNCEIHRYGLVSTRCPAELPVQMMKCAKAAATTPLIVLRAAARVVLVQWTRQTDLVTHSIAMGRPEEDMRDIVGMLRGHVAIRVSLSDDPTFEELMRAVQREYLSATTHELSFQVADERQFGPPMRWVENFVVTTRDRAEPGAGWTPLPLYPRATTLPVELALLATLSNTSLGMSCAYAGELHEREEMQLLLARITAALLCFVAEPKRRISQFTNVF